MSEEKETITPTIRKPRKVAKRTIDPQPTKRKTKIAGSEFVADLDDYGLETSSEYIYWVGVLPKCPVPGLDVAGIGFPKMTERLIKDPLQSGKMERIPGLGGFARLTEAKVQLLRERLPRVVLRFTEDEGQRDEPGTGQNMGEMHIQPRKGYPVTIPSKKDIKDGSRNRYIRGDRDEPAARYMFAVLCQDQDHPTRGEFCPPSLEETGLEWPDGVED